MPTSSVGIFCLRRVKRLSPTSTINIPLNQIPLLLAAEILAFAVVTAVSVGVFLLVGAVFVVLVVLNFCFDAFESIFGVAVAP